MKINFISSKRNYLFLFFCYLINCLSVGMIKCPLVYHGNYNYVYKLSLIYKNESLNVLHSASRLIGWIDFAHSFFDWIIIARRRFLSLRKLSGCRKMTRWWWNFSGTICPVKNKIYNNNNMASSVQQKVN